MKNIVIGSLIWIAAFPPPAKPITPEQAISAYESHLEQDLWSPSPSLPLSPSPPLPLTPSPMTTLYKWPTAGIITSGYGWRWGRMHNGIDIAAPAGTPITASRTGIIQSAGWNDGGYGYLVEIKHNDGSLTRYAHNNEILVAVGQHVIQGQAIALMGSTGNSTGPHLHFEISTPEQGSIDPLAMLMKKAAQ